MATDTSVWAVIKQPTDFFKEKNTKLFLPVPMRLLIKAFLGDMMVGVMITYVDDVLAVGPKSIVAPVISVVKKFGLALMASTPTMTNSFYFVLQESSD